MNRIRRFVKRMSVVSDYILRCMSMRHVIEGIESNDSIINEMDSSIYESTNELKWIIDDSKRDKVLCQKHVNISTGVEHWFPVPEVK